MKAARAGRPEDLIVFIGPSLNAREARAIAPCRVLPPARQGDLWRALSFSPRAIALIDGVFHRAPSVWHREILAAMRAGVAVFGAASMGALRASELWTLGMIGVGSIFRWYRDGAIRDDAEVALLHAGPELEHRAFTVPLVNVRHSAALARAAGVLANGEARRLVARGATLHYQDRTWPALLEACGFGEPTRERFEEFLKSGNEDLKARDARACIGEAARFVAASAPAPQSAGSGEPSLARRRRLLEGEARWNARAVRGARVLERLDRSAGAPALVRRGLVRSLISAWAREQGLFPARDQVEAIERAWLDLHGVRPARRAELYALCGLDAAEARRLFEGEALMRMALESAERMVSDGPSRLEALGSQAQLEGSWAKAARALLRPRPGSRHRGKR